MNKKKVRMLCLRALTALCGLCWYIAIYRMAALRSHDMVFFLIAYAGGALSAFLLSRSPGAAAIAVLFPMFACPFLALNGLFIQYPLSRHQRSEALWKAYWQNDINEVEWLLQKPVDLVRKTGDGETLLTHSYKESRFTMFKALLAGGADPNQPGAKSWTPLMLACEKGDLEAIRLLIDKRAQIEARNVSGFTPLYFAAANQRLDAVRLLLEHGANVNAPDKDGWTPLMFIVYKDYMAVFQFLAANKANIHAVNNAGCSALFIAAANGRSEMVERLLALGAEIDNPDLKGETPVQAALRNHHLPTVDLLLKNGAAVDAAFLEKVAAAKAKPEKSELPPPVFSWSGDDFAGGNMTDMELLRAENTNAISWFAAQKFVPIPTALGEKGAADYCFDMATIAQNSGVVKEAWAGFHQALRRYAKLGDDRMTGLTCFNLGKAYGAQSNWKMAEMMFQHSASMTSRSGEEKGLAWALFYLGDTRQKRGDKSECRYYWLLAQEIFNRVSPGDAKNVETALKNL